MRIVRVYLVGCLGLWSDASSDWLLGSALFVVLATATVLRSRSEKMAVAQDDSTCVGCRYDLAGLGASGLCPECGLAFPAERQFVVRSTFSLDPRRTPAVRLAIALALAAAAMPPWMTASNGLPVALEDVGWAWQQTLAGTPHETLDLMLRNRAQARRGDRSAASFYILLAAPSVLWAFLPAPRWRLGAVAIHAAAAMLGVVLAAFVV